MKRKNTLWSLVLALVMVLGVFAPLSALAAQPTEEVTEHVTLHKILMDKASLDAFTEGTKGKDGSEYVGKEITDVKKFFLAEDNKDGKAEEIDGVYFVWQKADDKTYPDGRAKYIKGVKKAENQYTEPAFDGEGNLVFTDKISEAFGGLTGANGIEFDTSKLVGKLKGEYEINEIHSMSTYGKDDEAKKEQLTSTKAVPVKITLPLYNNDGVVTEAHVYPKNTEEGPKIDKNFDKEGENAVTDKDIVIVDKTQKVDLDVNPDNPDRTKPRISKKIGDKVPFKVATTIPKDAKYKVLTWSDTMDAGLVYNKESLKVKLGDKELEAGDYTLKETDQGFTLTLTEAGLKKVSDAAITAEQTITITYSATIKDDVVPDEAHKNKVKLTYGNNPDQTKEKEPTPPEVVTGGKRFVKTNNEDVGSDKFKRLSGATFYVKNDKNEYLVATGEGADKKYTWGAKDDDGVVILTSGKNGEFEITGLAYGKYKLEEKDAPEGFAKLSGDIEFTVGKDSYTKEAEELEGKQNTNPIGYTKNDDTVIAKRIPNMEVTIPQTGGIGTMIFMVAGLALMGGAFIAMRKRSAEQA